MQRLEVSGAIRPLYGPLDVKGLTKLILGCPPCSYCFYLPRDLPITFKVKPEFLLTREFFFHFRSSLYWVARQRRLLFVEKRLGSDLNGMFKV